MGSKQTVPLAYIWYLQTQCREGDKATGSLVGNFETEGIIERLKQISFLVTASSFEFLCRGHSGDPGKNRKPAQKEESAGILRPLVNQYRAQGAEAGRVTRL